MSTIRQLRALLYKNWIQKKRRWISTLLEIALPLLVMLLLVWIHSFTEAKNIPENLTTYDGRDYKMFTDKGTGLMDHLKYHMEQTHCNIAFVPETAFSGVSNFLKEHSGLPKERFVNFESEFILEQYVALKEYGQDNSHRAICAALVDQGMYNGVGIPTVPQFSYDLRMNASENPSLRDYDAQSIPDTHLDAVDKMEKGYNDKEWKMYYERGFFMLQSLTDLFVLKRTGAIQMPDKPTVAEVENILKLRIQPFPAYEYRKDAFATAMGDYIGMFFTLVFIWPVTRIVASIVEEKELKIKEGMKIMGLSSESLTLSWIITYGVMFILSCILIVAGTFFTLYENSDVLIVFAFFLVFCAAVYSYSFMMSTLFDKANVASTVAAIVFIASFFVYTPIKEPSVDRTSKIIACIFPSVALALSSTAGAKLESVQLGITKSTMNNVYENFAFSDGLTMLLFDAVLYFVVGLYLEQIVKSEYGVEKPWYFIFTWCFGSKKDSKQEEQNLDSGFLAESGYMNDDIMTLNEPYTKMEAPSSHEKGQEMITIRNLKKVFSTKKEGEPDKEFVAVRDLSLDMYKGQIFTLLGHNGAGKSTTISMLTGLLSPTSGDVKILGRDSSQEMSELRKHFGYCPQHDLLYPYLSVEEHLQLYCSIKNVPVSQQQREIDEMIDSVGLGVNGDNKRYALAGTLSGGQMRKLSVAIALIGGSSVVFLDEPSSGMDVASQRFIWELLLRSKKDRMILLTTHSMEEAEIGDRIAILAHSVLQCCGSSLYLKKNYGCGYSFTVSKNQDHPNTHSDQGPFMHNCTTYSGSVIAEFLAKEYPFAELMSDAGGEISFRLPFIHVEQFPAMFEAMDANMNKLGVASYSISVTTLTEVFLRVGDGQERAEDIVSPVVSPPTSPTASNHRSFTFDGLGNIPYEMPVQMAPNSNGSVILNNLPSSDEPEETEKISIDDVYSEDFKPLSGNSKFKEHTMALLQKRFQVAKRDKKQWMWQLLYPAIILIVSLMLQKSSNNPYFPVKYISSALYGDNTPIVVAASADSGRDLLSYYRTNMNKQEVPADEVIVADGRISYDSFSKYLLSSGKKKVGDRYLAVALDDVILTDNQSSISGMIYFNTTARDSLAVSWTALTNALIRKKAYETQMTDEDLLQSAKHDKVYGPAIITRSVPFQRTENEMMWLTASVAFSLAMAFSFVPATFASFLVKERVDNGKHLQIISGVSPYAYWFSTLAWDLINFIMPFCMGMCVLFLFQIDALLGDAIGGTVMVFWLFCLSVAPFVYCLSFLFDNHSAAQNMILLLNFLVSVILLIVMIVMDSMSSTHGINSVLRYFYRLLPPFCFGEGVAALIMRKSPSYHAVPPPIFSLEITGWPCIFMAFDFVQYGAILLYIEYATSHEHGLFSKKEFVDDNRDTLGEEEDNDVAQERANIENGKYKDYNTYSIVVDGLRKVYPSRMGSKPHVATNNMSFAVKKGECFGYLGANGAGKSTTMKMLTGLEHPTRGTAKLGGFDIKDDVEDVRQIIGYCPQFDAIHPILTAREHLVLYARIKCVPHDKIPGFVNYLLEKLGLDHLQEKPAGVLSGGNKRKLSVGIALIGNPKITFLDEISSGVDVSSRRNQWKLISSTMHHRSVILTTHSMEEAEALCDRISIVTSGNLRALGSATHLKNKFGQGWQLTIKAREGFELKMKRNLDAVFKNLELIEEHGLNLKFSIPKSNVTIAQVFRALNKCSNQCGIETYSVSETTLEQVFVSLVQKDLNRLAKLRTEEAAQQHQQQAHN